MAIIGAQDLGGGRYSFTDDGGESYVLAGDAARRKAEMLAPSVADAATAPPPDDRMAMADQFTTPLNASDVQGMMATEQANRAIPTGTHDAPPPNDPGMTFENPKYQLAPKPPETAPFADVGAPGAARTPQGAPSAGIGLPPVRRVAAQWTPRAATIERGVQIPDDVRKRIDASYDAEQKANTSAAQTAEKRFTEEAQARAEEQVAAQVAAAEERQRAQSQQAQIQAATDRYQKMADEVGSQQIDPDKFWHDKDTGTRIGVSLMMAFGQFASGMTGAPNKAAEIIQDAIHRDIDAQKANLANKRASLDAQGNVLAMTRQNFASVNEQMAAARALSYKAAEAKLSTIAAQYKNPEYQAAAQQTQAQLERLRAQEEAKLAQATQDHVVMQSQFVPEHTVGGGPARVEELDRRLIVDDGSGGKLAARSPEEAQDLHKKFALTKLAVDAANEMHEVAVASAGQKLDPTSDLGQRFDKAQEQFVNASNALQEQGVVRGEDIDRYRKITGGKYGLATADMARNLAATVHRNYTHQVKAKAEEVPIREEFVNDPTKGIRRRAVYDMDASGRIRQPQRIQFTPIGGGKR